ncbi:glycosyltransferase family 4 protein [Paenibacillus sp. Soil787]|uniref:glycosyltransferase family 4 protein n=1 Tax=Paenibacillus sp. Soil787 TaxID=1736411 RepID=UPI0007035E8F|nr:glycosyltransferase [Paenibacillus sp. Soil787]KRF21591.1 glycosyl transferase family 1 [Paenibacillus sp. Soil787]
MKVLWAHDHTFYFNDSGKFFSSGKLPYAVWERYLSVFDQITVASRAKKISSGTEIANKSLSSGKNVDFIVLPSLSNPVNKLTKKGYIERILTESIRQSDAVIARLPSEIGSEAIAIAKKLGKPFAVEMVACAWDALWNYGNAQGKAYALFATMKTKSQVKDAPFAIYVTKQFLQNRYPNSKGYTEGCSDVEIPETCVSVLNQRMDKIESDTDNPIVLGLIGNLNGKVKGIATVLEALAKIQSKLPPFQFRILGGGEIGPWKVLAAKYGLQDRVFFDGVRESGDAVFEWLDRVDVYLQPSFQEGLPRATVEAMSRGCPVIGSTAGGIPELIDKSCLHKPGSDKQLARLIEENITNKTWLAEQARTNFVKAGSYTKVQLDQNRQEFWEKFSRFVQEGAN